MLFSKADIKHQLQQQIYPLQGLKHAPVANALNVGLGPIEAAFPNASFPIGAIHEFLSIGMPGAAATSGFIAGLLSALMQNNGASIWISASRLLFPPALKAFGLEPDRIIFVDVHNEKEALWSMEEALKCNGLAAVIGELPEISFTASRRLQLAVEQSRVTGFILRQDPRNLSTTACVSRWKITPLVSVPEDDMPGVGFPRWNVELLKIRNGKPGSWELEWAGDRFHICPSIMAMPEELIQKTG